jgi:hypothetical protein
MGTAFRMHKEEEGIQNFLVKPERKIRQEYLPMGKIEILKMILDK